MAASDQTAPVVWPTTRCKNTRALIDFLVAEHDGIGQFTLVPEQRLHGVSQGDLYQVSHLLNLRTNDIDIFLEGRLQAICFSHQ